MTAPSFRRLTALTTAEAFRDYLDEVGVTLPLDADVAPDGALAQPLAVAGRTIGNRFAALPMEGWDCDLDGRPTALTTRRWQRIGAGGAKLVWGGEAAAVRADGRASANQMVITDDTVDDVRHLRQTLVDAHVAATGTADDLVVGLQLTHSGRYAKPSGSAAPLVAYEHPVLDQRFPDGVTVLEDDELDALVDDFVAAAVLAERAGFHFVDIKHCHGYLAHELLSARQRPGPYGGSLEHRTHFLRQVVQGLRANTSLAIGVRLSVADTRPHRPGPDHVGVPEEGPDPYWPVFGATPDGLHLDLADAHAFIEVLRSLDIDLLCATIGSPYYNPHLQRPAAFPPSDGYLPPEDPLHGVQRHLDTVREIKQRHPWLTVVGSGYSYLQQWLPNVAQAVVDAGHADVVGLGRMVLSYPDMPLDVMTGRSLTPKKICRTFSDCTTAPRHGLVSGCYPLDPAYKSSPEAAQVRLVKKELKEQRR